MPSMPISEETSQELPAAESVQNQREMQLVMLFQGLIFMDRHPYYSITAAQSAAILPVVRKSMEEGSIDESERKAIINVLTDEQKTFLDDQSKQVKLRMADRMNNHRDNLSAAEREKFVNAFEKKRKVEQQEETGTSSRVNNENQTPDPRGMGDSIEQQLVKLLVSKK
ncbi:hypothetical protein A8709_25570 [Paenibacillus pectinilyticus]|uniref:Uncharacterized protein n=2 Tax=Paenibacillus pectinilyticus TaxID=512399 RepID=A0A1C1A0Y8_9BACL|nr:hypothetical protein A8709_25570 [Paenibacillus pectinilyticus]